MAGTEAKARLRLETVGVAELFAALRAELAQLDTGMERLADAIGRGEISEREFEDHVLARQVMRQIRYFRESGLLEVLRRLEGRAEALGAAPGLLELVRQHREQAADVPPRP